MRTELLTAFVTLFVVVDPLGLAPLFMGLTRGLGPARTQVATQASLIGFAVLAGAALIGDWLLRTLGIGLPAFRIAGGLLLFATAFEQIFGRRQVRKMEQAAVQENDTSVAAFPLAIPFIAGPGAITATLLLAERTGGDAKSMALLFLTIGVVVGLCYGACRLAPWLEKALGEKGEIVLARLLGVLLAAMAVEYVIDGVLALRAV